MPYVNIIALAGKKVNQQLLTIVTRLGIYINFFPLQNPRGTDRGAHVSWRNRLPK